MFVLFIAEAAGFKGKDSLKNMRDTIKQHVYSLKNTMFEQAKDEMLGRLRKLKVCLMLSNLIMI